MERTQAVVRPTRGEIYLVSFDPTLGAEIRKTRPALVIQNDVGNRHSPITIVAAISPQFDENLPRPKCSSRPPRAVCASRRWSCSIKFARSINAGSSRTWVRSNL